MATFNNDYIVFHLSFPTHMNHLTCIVYTIINGKKGIIVQDKPFFLVLFTGFNVSEHRYGRSFIQHFKLPRRALLAKFIKYIHQVSDTTIVLIGIV